MCYSRCYNRCHNWHQIGATIGAKTSATRGEIILCYNRCYDRGIICRLVCSWLMGPLDKVNSLIIVEMPLVFTISTIHNR